MTRDELMKKELEALENKYWDRYKEGWAQPKREWVGLTREEINIIVDRYSDSCDVGGVCGVCDGVSVVDAAEAKLKEKNYD